MLVGHGGLNRWPLRRARAACVGQHVLIHGARALEGFPADGAPPAVGIDDAGTVGHGALDLPTGAAHADGHQNDGRGED
jgi:hypothetical protein